MNQKLVKIAIALLGSCFVLVAFITGYIIIGRRNSTPSTSSSVATTAVSDVPDAPATPAPDPIIAQPAPPAVEAPVIPAPHAAAFDPATNSKLEDPASWTPTSNGCLIEQTGTQLHITGTHSKDGWGAGDGIASSKLTAADSFFAQVDFMVPKYTGPGNALVYLLAKAPGGKMVAILFQPNARGYQVQGWNQSNSFSQPALPKFGDEKTAFHRMKLKYDAASHLASGWVDDRFIGNLSYDLGGPVTFEVLANSDKAGTQIDLLFDHLTVTTDLTKAPETPIRPAPIAPAPPPVREAPVMP